MKHTLEQLNEAMKCPKCGDLDWDIDDESQSELTYLQFCICKKCKTSWTKTYLFAHIDEPQPLEN